MLFIFVTSNSRKVAFERKATKIKATGTGAGSGRSRVYGALPLAVMK